MEYFVLFLIVFYILAFIGGALSKKKKERLARRFKIFNQQYQNLFPLSD